MIAPATPAPADGAPGERESADSFELDALRGLVRAERTWNDYAWRLAARGVLSSAAPLPAPSSSAGVGAETLAEWRELATDLINEGWPADELAHQVAAALRSACDALSTAADPVRPSREAMTSALVAIAEAARPGGRDGLAIDAAIRSARALVFGDSAPGEDGTR